MTGRPTGDGRSSSPKCVVLALVVLVAGAGVLAGVAVGASPAGEPARAVAPQPSDLEPAPGGSGGTTASPTDTGSESTNETSAAGSTSRSATTRPTTTTGPAGNWPMYGHDPAHTGYNPGTEGPRGSIGVARTFDGAGTTYSGAVVVDGTVYYTSGGQDAGWQGYAYAEDVETGERLWRTRIGPEEGPAVPALVDGVLYVAGSTSQQTDEGRVPIGELYALDPATGEVLWTVETPVDSYTNGAIVSSPTVAGGTVYFGSNNDHVYAVDAATGRVQWRYDTGLDVQTSPAVADGTVYVGADSRTGDGDESVLALDAATGDLEWSAVAGPVTTTPTVADGTVFVLTGDDLVAFDAASGTEAWTRSIEEGYYRATMVVRGDTLYYPAGGDLHAVSTADGSERWTVEGIAAGGRVASPSAQVVSAADTLYVSSQEFDAVTAVDVESGSVVGSAEVPSIYRLAVADGRVFVTELHGDVHVLDQGPRAAVSVSPAATATGRPVTFDASASADPDGSVASYRWDFDGDGTPDAEGQRVEHTFATAGTHEVGLTVVDDDGIANATTVAVEVERALVASLDVQTPVTVGERVTLDASGTLTLGGTPTYRWDVDGDGEDDARGESLVVRFERPGYYRVALLVESENGTTDNASAVVHVLPTDGAPATVSWGAYRADDGRTGVATSAPGTKPTVAWSASLGGTDGGGAIVAPVVAYGRVYAGLGGNLTAVGDWRRSVQGHTWLSPAVADGRLFVTTGDVDRGGVLAHDPATGETLWNATWPEHSFVYSTPVATNGTVFVAPSRGGSPANGRTGVVALDASDGTERWNTSLAGLVSSSPALADGTVYVVANTATDRSRLSAVDAATGTVEWQTDVDGVSLVSSPVVADGTVYVASRAGGVRAFDAGDGTRRWSALGDVQFVSTPVVAGDTVYAPAIDGTVHALDAASGETVWTTTAGREILGSATVASDRVYVATTGGSVVALDAATGDRVWNVSVSGGVISDPVVADGTLYVVDGDGRLVALSVGGAGGNVTVASTSEPASNDTADGDGGLDVDSVPAPGFGPVAALLAVALAAGVLRRRA